MNRKERNRYIDNIDVEEARDRYYKRLNLKPKYEEVDVVNSLGR